MAGKENYLEKLIALAEKEEDVCGKAPVYRRVTIKQANAMMDAINKEKPMIEMKSNGISYMVPPNDLTIEERRAINFLIVGFLHSGNKEKEKWAKRTFFERNQGFVGQMITKNYSTYVKDHYDDLFQAGSIGLLKALEKLDPSVSPTASSTSYPTKFVMHELYVEINGKVTLTSLKKKIQTAKKDLEGLGITDDRIDTTIISAWTGLPSTQVELANNYIEFGETVSLTEVSEVSAIYDPEKENLIKERKDVLNSALSGLTEKEARCIELQYDFGENGDDLHPGQVAQKMRITPGEVEKLTAQAFEKLRKNPEILALFKPGEHTDDDGGEGDEDDGDITDLVT